MAKPKVLITINSSWNIFNFRSGLIRRLLADGYEVVAAAPMDDFSSRLTAMGARHVPVAIRSRSASPLGELRLLSQYRRLLMRERPDVVLAYTVKPNIHASLAAHSLGIPVINNVAGLGTVFIRETILSKIVRWLYRLAFSRSRTVFFQNGTDRDLFVSSEIVPAGKTRILPGSGIDLAAYPLPASAGANRGRRFILIARLLRDKGVVEYVEAARLLRATIPDAHCALLGFLDVDNRTAVTRAEVDRWVEEKSIEYLGSTEDVRPYIANADCVVLPSYREGLPRTLLEGAAMGKPLIATDVPGCRDVVDDGNNGLLCAVRDARSLADAMIAFARLPAPEREAMGRRGRAKVEEEFDERIVIERYVEAIDSARKTLPSR